MTTYSFSISWCEDGRAVMHYHHEGKRRLHRLPATIRTEKDAEKYARAFVAELAPVVVSASLTVRAIVERWWALRASTPRIAPSTRRQDRYTLTSHVLPVLGDLLGDELSVPTLRTWLRGLVTEGKSTSTIRNTYSTFALCLDDAMAEGWVDWQTNPLRHPGVKKELPKASKSSRLEIKYFSNEQIKLLCTDERIPTERRVRYLFAICTGLRDGEISGLSWGHLRDGLVYVDRALALCGSKPGTELRAPKTESSIRLVPIHPVLALILRLWRLDHGEPPPTEPVFPSPGGSFWRPRSADYLRDDLKKLGISQAGLTFHATRRTFATLLANAGVPEGTIGLLMGHVAAGVTSGHYTAATISNLRDAVNLMALDFLNIR